MTLAKWHFILSWFLFILIGCCPKFQPAIVKKISEPLKDRVLEYYKKNTKFPSSLEFTKLLLSVGCSHKSGVFYQCDGKKYKIFIPYYGDSKDSKWIYEFYIKYKGTQCVYHFDTSGAFVRSCQGDKCFGDSF